MTALNTTTKSLAGQVSEIIKNGWIQTEPGASSIEYLVQSLDHRNEIVKNIVYRNFKKRLVCNCREFIEEFQVNENFDFQCQHILAVEISIFNKPVDFDDLENKRQSRFAIKWRCHHLTRRKIERLMEQISNHPQGMSDDDLRRKIREVTGDKHAPEDLSEEGAERLVPELEKLFSEIESAAAALESSVESSGV